MALETSRELPSGKDIDRLIADSMDSPDAFLKLVEHYKNGTLPLLVSPDSDCYELVKLAAQQNE